MFRDFELEYKELAGKMRHFDKEVVGLVRLRWTEFHDALLRAIIEELTAIIEKQKYIKGKFDNAPTFIVDQGILPALQELPEQVAIPDVKQLWEEARADFLALTNRPEILARRNELEAATGKYANVSEALSEELSTLRNRLGTEYEISRDQYFVPEDPTVYLQEG